MTLKYAGNTELEVLTSVFKKVLKEEVSPPKGSASLTLSLFKKEGDALLYRKYRRLRLLKHSKKIWEHILPARLKKTCQYRHTTVWVPGWKINL